MDISDVEIPSEQLPVQIMEEDSKTTMCNANGDRPTTDPERETFSDLASAFGKMNMDDDPTVIFSDSTESSSGSLDRPKKSLQKLNEFLSVCGDTEYAPIGQPNKTWEIMSNRSKNIYISRATKAIVSVLNVITPGDADHLWQASSRYVDEALGVSQPAQRKYLEALAETYQNAVSWDTRRQILAIMADLVSYRQIQQFIPGLTEYRFKAARIHLLKHGRGTPVPKEKSPRFRIDENQLDHFLSFITSSHVVQDLPFGQRYLHLANGQVLETPNVIRLMIPQMIIDQYT
ncbi:hypothetical protein QZH41_001410 [Actinostola sp. cb2023]|nr:hypothetical protein QZH41_001410 [Actinostola sp. cb2023]